jgi:hypothetical protein
MIFPGSVSGSCLTFRIRPDPDTYPQHCLLFSALKETTSCQLLLTSLLVYVPTVPSQFTQFHKYSHHLFIFCQNKRPIPVRYPILCEMSDLTNSLWTLRLRKQTFDMKKRNMDMVGWSDRSAKPRRQKDDCDVPVPSSVDVRMYH